MFLHTSAKQKKPKLGSHLDVLWVIGFFFWCSLNLCLHCVKSKSTCHEPAVCKVVLSTVLKNCHFYIYSFLLFLLIFHCKYTGVILVSGFLILCDWNDRHTQTSPMINFLSWTIYLILSHIPSIGSPAMKKRFFVSGVIFRNL